MSERAKKILTWLRNQETSEIWIRQATLAAHFNCSRRTIGRCLKELKAANLLVDLNKRHDNRCKMYLISGLPAEASAQAGEVLTPEAALQWKLYSKTFGIAFRMFDGQQGRPLLEPCFREVALGLKEVKAEAELYSKLFAGLWAHPEYKAAEKSWFDGVGNSASPLL